MGYDGAIVVVVQLEADIGDVLHEADLVFIEVEQKLDQSIDRKVGLFIVSESHKGQHQRLLLLDLIRQQDLTALFLEDQEDDGAGYGGE